ncbi:MAG: rhodanese-like domain-containing protein [Oscillospiraceae bacterium]|nr:rhodanese-like domain-containing protein [Oscillospiraceae bacterium]
MESTKHDTVYKNLMPEQALKMMTDISTYTILLDVRRTDEYQAGHIKGAVNLPLSRILSDSKAVLPDTEQEIIVYCHSGQRSKTACLELCNMGYCHVYDLGGIIDWPYDVVVG